MKNCNKPAHTNQFFVSLKEIEQTKSAKKPNERVDSLELDYDISLESTKECQQDLDQITKAYNVKS